MNTTFSVLFWMQKNRTVNDVAPILVRITINGKRTEISTNRKVPVNAWDPQSQTVTGKSQAVKELNNYFVSLKAKILSTYSKLEARGATITIESFKKEFTGEKPIVKTMLNIIDEYLSILGKRVETDKSSLKPTTFKRFKTLKEKIQAFIKFQYNAPDLPITEVFEAFAEELLHYLITEDSLCHNTAMKYLKMTKQIMQWSKRKGYVTENPIANFKCTYKQPKRPRLTWHELINLYRTTMPVKRLEEVKDVYVFTCFTGYSYMDIYELTPDNVVIWIDGQKWLIRDRYKGDHNKSNVPLLEIPLEIINKYKEHPYCKVSGKLLPVNSNQRYNGYLKEIADIAGINKTLTTHTARHTFATTILLENDCPIESASEMLGHNSIRTTQIYAKTTDVKVSLNMKSVKEKIEQKFSLTSTGT